jgi:hypothetical protein
MTESESAPITLRASTVYPGGVQVDLTRAHVDAIVLALAHESLAHFDAAAIVWQLLQTLMRWQRESAE